MSMPAATASATVAAVPKARSSTLRPVSLPMVDLREVPISVGKPSATSRSSARSSARLCSGSFPEPDAGVEHDVLGRDAGGDAPVRGVVQKRQHLVDHVAFVHRDGLIVHHHDRRRGLDAGGDQIGGRTPDRVEQIAAGGVRVTKDLRLERIDRDDRLRCGGAQGGDRGEQARAFGRGVDRLIARPASTRRRRR